MLTFEEAKLRVNPDPDWQPTRSSDEYKEIIALMRHSGETFLDHLDKAPVPLTVSDCFVNNTYKNPISNPKMLVPTKRVSKNEFLSLPSNKRAFINHLTSKIPTERSIQVTVSKEMLQNLKTAGIPKTAKGPQRKMSKQEFLNQEDNREYMRLHCILNNK